MCFNSLPIAVIASLAAFSDSAAADSLGFRFADATIGATNTDTGAAAYAHLGADFAISDAHGLQLDLAVVSYGSEFLGQIDAHLYMMPTEAAKYGLFFSLADIDGREATIAMAGVEGMFALSDRIVAYGRAGLGMALPGDMDFITVSFGASHALGDNLSLFGDVTVLEVDEASLRTVVTSARLGARYQPIAQPWEMSFAIVQDALHGRDAAKAETRAELGFTWHLGDGGGAKRRLATRAFASPQPFDALLRRGVF